MYAHIHTHKHNYRSDKCTQTRFESESAVQTCLFIRDSAIASSRISIADRTPPRLLCGGSPRRRWSHGETSGGKLDFGGRMDMMSSSTNEGFVDEGELPRRMSFNSKFELSYTSL